MDHPAVDAAPAGDATIETYTVVHGRNGPEFGIVLGRLNGSGRRFVAHTPGDMATLQGMMARDMLGAPGRVTPGTADAEGRMGVNTFVPGA